MEEFQSEGRTRGGIAWAVLRAMIAFVMLSHTYEIIVVSLLNWQVISQTTTLELFEQSTLIAVHILILISAVGVAATSNYWRVIAGKSLTAAAAWTATSVSGHFLAARFC